MGRATGDRALTAGCVSARAAPGAVHLADTIFLSCDRMAYPVSMRRWSYRVLQLDFLNASEPAEPPAGRIEDALNRAGEQGWELVKSDFLVTIASANTTRSSGPQGAISEGHTTPGLATYIAVLKKPV
jgi:hypothetical protein